MAFARFAYGDSLRDVETCIRAQAKKLYYMGISSGASRSTLAAEIATGESMRISHSTLSAKPVCSIGTTATGAYYGINEQRLRFNVNGNYDRM